MIETSVVVPSFNRPETLRQCLIALLAQQGDGIEIVVVDDGSPEPLEDVCQSVSQDIRCIRQANAGPAAARNRAVAEATGRFVAFTDDDCRPRPDWIRHLRAAHDGTAMRLVGGAVTNMVARDIWADASQELWEFLYDHFGATEGNMPFFTSNNMGCARDDFLTLGGFDQTFPLAAAEDRDFGMRWRDAGGALHYAPGALVDHHHAMSLRKFWRQQSNYGRGARHLDGVLDARGARGPKRQPAAFYRDLLLYPIRRHGLRGLPLAARFALSQAAVTAGYAAYRRQRTDA